MKHINFSKHILPHLVAIGVFLVVVFIFFSPQITENKALYQHDVFQGRVAGQDLLEYRESTGEEPLWTNSMFSGMPAYLISTDYKDAALKLAVNILSVGLPNPASYVFISLICFYILLLCFGVRPYLAIAGALVYGLTSFTLISLNAGHNSKIHAVAYWPLVIAGIRLVFSGKKILLGAALTALALALELKANHLQMTYYLLIITIGYGLTELIYHIVTKRTAAFIKAMVILIAAALMAVLANSGRLWTVYEYGQYTIRGGTELTPLTQDESAAGLDKSYAFQYSNGLAEPLVMFVPNILGGSTQEALEQDSALGKAMRSRGVGSAQIGQQLRAVPTYWGDQPGTAPYYAGAVTFFLLILGLIFARRKYVIWLISIGIFGIILTYGKNLEAVNYFLFDYLPGYNKFRSVTFAIIIPIFCFTLLGMLGTENLLRAEKNREVVKKFYLALGVAGGFMFLLVVIAGTFSYSGAVDARLTNLPSWFLDALKEDREAMLRADAFRSLTFILLAGGAIFLYLKNRLTATLASLLLVFLVTLDMSMVGKKFLNDAKFVRAPYRSFVQATPADKFIQQSNRTGKRILDLSNPFAEARASYHHQNIGGYHGAKLGRYQELIERQLTPEIQQVYSTLGSGSRDFSKLPALNMLNTGYFLAGNQTKDVVLNTHTHGNAWFVTSVRKVNSADEEIAALGKVNTRETAVIDISKFPLEQSDFNNGMITLEEKTPRKVTYQYSNPAEGLAVFSEIYYEKGWKAFIDGEPAEILRANYVLRALRTPAGSHKIEFRFEPASYKTGSTITSLVSWGVFLLFLASLVITYKNSLPNEESTAG